MADLFGTPRKGPSPQALHFSYEKAGLTLDNQPVPWNAEAVLVEASLRLPPAGPRTRDDFALRLGGAGGFEHRPELLRTGEGGTEAHLFFRLPVPDRTAQVELFWRERSLGQMTLPVLSRDDFQKGVQLQLPTLSVRLSGQTLACQTFVGSQCQGLVASALIQASSSLVPIVDLGLRVELRPEKAQAEAIADVAVALSSTQLRGKQALVATMLPKPRRQGVFLVTWFLEGRALAVQRIKAISDKKFLRSLRISTTRFVLQGVEGSLAVARYLPPHEDILRVGPCFLVCSSEAGMAGLCKLHVTGLGTGKAAFALQEHEVLITDGPTPFIPGTLDVEDLADLEGFELRHKEGAIGVLPLVPVPTARFDSEGGYKSPQAFAWSPLAEEQLHDRLSRLLGDGNGHI